MDRVRKVAIASLVICGIIVGLAVGAGLYEESMKPKIQAGSEQKQSSVPAPTEQKPEEHTTPKQEVSTKPASLFEVVSKDSVIQRAFNDAGGCRYMSMDYNTTKIGTHFHFNCYQIWMEDRFLTDSYATTAKDAYKQILTNETYAKYNITSASVTLFTDVSDDYGHFHNITVAETTWSKDTAKRINWDSFDWGIGMIGDSGKVFRVAEKCWIDPRLIHSIRLGSQVCNLLIN